MDIAPRTGDEISRFGKDRQPFFPVHGGPLFGRNGTGFDGHGDFIFAGLVKDAQLMGVVVGDGTAGPSFQF